MDTTAAGLQQIHHPIPAIGRLHDHFGSGPASPTAAAIAIGSLAIRTLESFSPVALTRTTTERRR
jgi:hypothetical protein